jgi:tRNA pseudouridine55 synthase
MLNSSLTIHRSSLALRGVLNINKPGSITSYDVIRIIRKATNVERRTTDDGRRNPRVKLGHAGTLDPMARGVLLVLFGEATKIADYLLGLEKEYVASVRLGRRTDTDDITGSVLEERPFDGITPDRLETVLRDFQGEIQQVPPVYSALKIAGVRSSDRARRGEIVAPKPRRITVYEIEATDFTPPSFRLRVVVSRGTYVRSLVRDIGDKLGCGATLEELTRTRIGDFRLPDAIGIDERRTFALRIAEKIIPLEQALSFLPEIIVDAGAARKLREGKALAALEPRVDPGSETTAKHGLTRMTEHSDPGSPVFIRGSETYSSVVSVPLTSPVRIRDEAGKMLVIARLDDGMWKTVRGIYADN